MGTIRTAWHIPFAALITERAPPGFEVIAELRLTHEPQRADLLLLRRHARPKLREARVVRRLWAWLPKAAVVEYKSAARPLRDGDLHRLLGYTIQYHVAHKDELNREDLAMVLFVPATTPTLDQELAELGWTLRPIDRGYYRMEAALYSAYLIVIDEVAEHERDELLGSFGDLPVESEEVFEWWEEHAVEHKHKTDIDKRPGYDQILAKLVRKRPLKKRLEMFTPEERLAGLGPEQRLAGLGPEQRLAGLGPEQRLVGLGPDEWILALPDDALRALSPDYLRTLPPKVQKAVDARLNKKRPSRRQGRKRSQVGAGAATPGGNHSQPAGSRSRTAGSHSRRAENRSHGCG